MKRRASVGSVEVITGSMFCGKTDELIRRLRREKVAKKKTQVFKPRIDTRYNPKKVVSHAGGEFDAALVGSAKEILARLEPGTEVVGIDEAQFLDEEIVGAVNKMASSGVRVIITGLDTDFRGEPFGPMPALIAQAERVDKLTAICMVCGSDNATFTQRIINGRPAKYGDPLIVVGGKEAYEARCREHHEVPGKPSRSGELKIGIVAPMGAGKSTLMQLLRRAWKGAIVVDEDFKNNPYLKKAYEGAEGYVFRSQMWYLGGKASELQKDKDKRFRMMVPLMVDMAYAKTYYRLGQISKDDWGTYLQQYSLITRLAKDLTPDIILRLVIRDKSLIQRVKDRGRTVEKEVKPKFLRELNNTLTEVSKISGLPQIPINVEKRDYRNSKIAKALILEIKKRILKLGYELPYV